MTALSYSSSAKLVPGFWVKVLKLNFLMIAAFIIGVLSAHDLVWEALGWRKGWKKHGWISANIYFFWQLQKGAGGKSGKLVQGIERGLICLAVLGIILGVYVIAYILNTACWKNRSCEWDRCSSFTPLLNFLNVGWNNCWLNWKCLLC